MGDPSPLGQLGALICQYLHLIPSEDWEEFRAQARQALWAEKRYFENMQAIQPRWE